MNYTTWLRWGVLAGIFIVPFVIFVAPPPGLQVLGNMFFPYITGKNFAFRIVVEVMFLFWVLLALKEPKYRPRASWLMWSALAFVGWMAIATGFSIDPIKSLWSNFERMEGYIGLVHLFAWFVVAGAVLSADKLWTRWFNVSIVASVMMGIYALLQVLRLWGFEPTSQSGARADTTFGNATYLAVYMLVMVFVTLYMLYQRRSSSMWQALYGLALVLQVMAIIFTETRGAILGLAAGLVAAAVYFIIRGRGKEWQTARRVAVGGLVVLALVGGGIYFARDTALVQSIPGIRRIASITLTETTVISRIRYIWPMALQGVAERPLAGWGQENFSFVFNANYDPNMWDQEQWFDRAHNQFLDWFVAGGVPAGLLYIALYILLVWGIVRSGRGGTQQLNAAEQAILFGLVAGFAFNNMFVFDNLVSGIYFFALLAFVHGMVRRELPSSMILTRPVGEHSMAVVAPIAAVIILGAGWAANAPGIARAHILLDAIQTQTAEGARNPADNLASFNAALGPASWPSNPLGIQEVTEQLAQYASSIGQRSATPQVVQDTLVLADEALTRLTTTRAGDARLELFYGSFLAGAGDLTRALEHLRAAQELSPQKQQILVQLGLIELQAGQADVALGHLKQAHELAPKYDFARIMYAAGHYYTGGQAVADALLVEGFGSVIVDSDQLLSVYIDTKQYTRAADIWRLRISKSPQNTDLYLGLAQMYFQAGDTVSTIATLREIQKIAPAQAGQIEQIITQIQNGTLKP